MFRSQVRRCAGLRLLKECKSQVSGRLSSTVVTTNLCLTSTNSSSGRPFRTPRGHSPAWTSKVAYSILPLFCLADNLLLQVSWLTANVFESDSYAHLLEDKTAVVHTLGTLLEETSYKQSIRGGDVLGLAGSLFRNMTGISFSGRNPLETDHKKLQSTYERINRDSGMYYISVP